MRIVHGKSIKPFKCDKCEYRCLRRARLNSHINSKLNRGKMKGTPDPGPIGLNFLAPTEFSISSTQQIDLNEKELQTNPENKIAMEVSFNVPVYSRKKPKMVFRCNNCVECSAASCGDCFKCFESDGDCIEKRCVLWLGENCKQGNCRLWINENEANYSYQPSALFDEDDGESTDTADEDEHVAFGL